MTSSRRAAALAVSVALLGSACQAAPDNADTPEQETRVLAGVLNGARLTQGRLSGFDQWSAWTGIPSPSEHQKGAVYRSALTIQKRQGSSTDAGWYASLGVRHLLVGDLPRATALLESSREMPGDRASRLNDLAVAYFAHALATKNAERLAHALDLAEAAARANPALLAARFNRALMLESIGPASRAAEAWSEYLAADASSGWAREAADRRERVTAAARQMRIGPAERQEVNRQIVEQHLLRWAQAVRTGDESAAAGALASADAAASDIRTRHTNTYPARLVEDARRHEREGRARAFADAYVTGDQGRDLIERDNAIAAGRSRIDAAARLVAPGGTFSDYLDYWRLRADWYRPDAPSMEQTVRNLIARSERNGSDYIAARSRVLLGSILQKAARYSEAIDSYQRGIDGYMLIGEKRDAAATCSLLAAALREHGMWQEAWRCEAVALSGYDGLTTDTQRHSVLHEAVRLALARRQTALAARFHEFLSAHAAEWKDAGALFAVSMAATRLALQRGASDANAELARAEQALGRVPDKNFRDSYRLEILTLETEVRIRGAPALALQSARTLLKEAERERVLFRRVRAYRLAGQAAMAAHNTTEAAAAWEKGIGALEDDNRTAREERLRIARTSDVWAIYEDLIGLLVDQDQDRKALEVAERGRARALLSALGPWPGPVTIDARLGARATVLFYSLLPTRTLVWVIDGRAIELHEIPGGAAGAADSSNELRAVATSQADPGPVLKRLYTALISRVAAALVPGRPVIVVPDGLLASVPFAALQSPETGRLLVQDHEIQVAPSLTLLQRALERRDSAAPARQVLAVASPDAAGTLPALPGASREVKDINALYGQRSSVLPDQFPVDVFLDNVRRSDVVHFAGHAVEDRDFPDRSYLAMPGSARLLPSQIRKSDFGGVRLLVLSACSTAEGAVERGEGILSLARPFLAAGVGQVLATVTAVDDDVAPLLVEFHRMMRQGMTPAAALKAVQVRAFESERKVSLRGWAAFELFGVSPSR